MIQDHFLDHGDLVPVLRVCLRHAIDVVVSSIPQTSDQRIASITADVEDVADPLALCDRAHLAAGYVEHEVADAMHTVYGWAEEAWDDTVDFLTDW